MINALQMPLMSPIRIARIMTGREYFAMKLKNFMDYLVLLMWVVS
jgi:hypothetical protein